MVKFHGLPFSSNSKRTFVGLSNEFLFSPGIDLTISIKSSVVSFLFF